MCIWHSIVYCTYVCLTAETRARPGLLVGVWCVEECVFGVAHVARRAAKRAQKVRELVAVHAYVYMHTYAYAYTFTRIRICVPSDVFHLSQVNWVFKQQRESAREAGRLRIAHAHAIYINCAGIAVCVRARACVDW